MNKKLLIVILAVFIFGKLKVHGQSLVNVNGLSGTVNVSIPIYQVNQGSVTCPISLVYSTSGTKPKDVEGTAGIGWQLQTGGSISRQVRGLPDDAYQDNAGNKNLIGWMYNASGAANIAAFTPANTGTGVSCPNETTDITYINSHFPYQSDTEPDVFMLSAPGLSCQLYYDAVNAKFVPVPYKDLVISYTTDNNVSSPTYKNITSFTVTNDHGTKYVFSVSESVTQKTLSSGTVNFFVNKYNQYKNGINYYDAWYLQSMADATGNGMSFTYTVATPRSGIDSVQFYLGGATIQALQYRTSTTVTPQVLASIQTIDAIPSVLCQFNWKVANTTTGQTVIDNIVEVNSLGGFTMNTHYFDYSTSYYTMHSGANYNRSFLADYKTVGANCSNAPLIYKFSYLGVNASNSTSLPDSTTTQVDYWGYYSTNPNNGPLLPGLYASPTNSNSHAYQVMASSTDAGYNYSLPGTNRAADATVIATGALSQITYPQGGTTSITYEPNDFYDPTSASVAQGGGIRVKQLTDYDGINSANNIVRNYSYLDPSTGLSSGKPISLPEYAFIVPYSGGATGLSLWENATAISANDISSEDHSILYTYSKISQAGAGATLYNYYVPATNWDVNAAPACSSCVADWVPTLNYAARTNCTGFYGIIKNDEYSYPFTTNINYDFERGLPKKVISYTETGAIAGEEDYTYQRTGTPIIINALSHDLSANSSNTIQAYAKYKIYASSDELTSSVVKTIYNSSSPISTTINYSYGPVQHKLSQQQATNSDGSTTISTIKYVKDYTVSAGAADANVNAIYHLGLLNINSQVETYTQTKVGTTTLTNSASLILFKGSTVNGNTFYLPSQELKFSIPSGASSFQPFTITSNVKSFDSRYYPIANYTTYDDKGLLQTADDANNNKQAVITEHTAYHPIAIFKNADIGEVRFSNFDSNMPTPDRSFTISGGAGLSGFGHAGNFCSLLSTQTISGTFNKNLQAGNYIVSAWIQAAAAGTLNFTLTSSTQTVTASKPYTATGGAFKYFEWKLPVALMGTTFTTSFNSSTNIGIDDILSYPENAEATTYSYDYNFNKSTSTNTNGVSNYYTYDSYGRLLYVYDQDKNIVQRKTYVMPADYQQTAQINVNENTNYQGYYLYEGAGTINFTAGFSSCTPSALTYTWDFGDGTTPVVTSSTSIAHNYSYTGPYGEYNVTVSITSSAFPGQTYTATKTIFVTNIVQISIENSTTGTSLSSIIFYQPGTTTVLYSFSSATSVIVPRATYDVKLNITGMQYPDPHNNANGYSSVLWAGCFNYSSSGYTFPSVDLKNGSDGYIIFIRNIPCP